MLKDMSDCGIADWLLMALISGAGFLVFVVLLLTIAVLTRYLFWGGRRDRPGIL